MGIYDKGKLLARHLCLFLSLIVCAENAFAQGASVSGRVTDDKGEVLGGATVLEKGTMNATVTDPNGNYTFRPAGADPVLVFSFVGYTAREIPVAGRMGNVDVILTAEVAAIDELVVVGYGAQRKVSVVGSQSMARGDQLKMPIGNLSNAFSGRLSGVVAVTRSGEPGHDDSDIWIRGLTTGFGQSAKPLILVDGVERGMNNIDPEDVESYTVLKDASATAVYGVRGANGVVIVTTKPGVVGTPKFNFDYYESFSRFAKTPEMADAYTYMNVANEAYKNYSPDARPLYSPEYIVATKKAHGILPNDNPRMYNEYLYPAVDWLKEIFNDWGRNRHANMNVRGGLPSANYYVSLSYFGQGGQTKNVQLENYDTKMSYDRYNFTSNLNLRPGSRTKVDLGFSGYLSSGHYPQQSSEDLFNATMQVNPVYLPKTMPDGSLSGLSAGGDLRNPYMDLAHRGFYEEFRNTLNSNIRVTQELDWFEWSKGLSASALMAFDAYNSRKLVYDRWSTMYYFGVPQVDDGLGPVTKDPETGLWNEEGMFDSEGRYRKSVIRDGSDNLGFDDGERGVANRTVYFETSLNYDRVFGKHRVGGLLLYNHRIYRDLTSDNADNSLPYKSRSYAGRATYSFDDRYLLEANVGINGSENFPPEKRYGVFPAAGAGWVVSNEEFWKPLADVVSYLKLRYTFGYVGSDQVADRRFVYQALMEEMLGVREGAAMNLTGGYGLTRYGIPLGWSRSRKQDIGIDINLFKDKFSLTVDLFDEYRDRIFLQRNILPDYAGFVEQPWANLGVTKNRGVEAQAEFNHNLSKDVSLTVRGNFTYNKSTIVENDKPQELYPWREERGTPLNAHWGYIADGLFTSYEEIAGHATQFQALHPGDIKYRDLNEDGKIDYNDQTVIGYGDVPRIYYGFGFDLSVRNWSLGALFQGIAQADRILGGRSIHPFSGNTGLDNLYSNITDRWNPADPTDTDVFYPRLNYLGESQTNNNQTSTWWKKDVSFLRLKQLNVAYRLPKRWMDKCFLDDASVYLMGTNIFTLSKFKLWDPELNTNNGNKYPNISSYSIGVKFSF